MSEPLCTVTVQKSKDGDVDFKMNFDQDVSVLTVLSHMVWVAQGVTQAGEQVAGEHGLTFSEFMDEFMDEFLDEEETTDD